MPLPPLPTPNYPAERDYADAWTADQMRAYAAEARAKALKDAARWVDEAMGRHLEAHGPGDSLNALMQTRDMLKVRALKDAP